MCIKSNLWQCRRKFSSSSFAIPQEQKGLKQSKLCRKLCAFSALNLKRMYKLNQMCKCPIGTSLHGCAPPIEKQFRTFAESSLAINSLIVGVL